METSGNSLLVCGIMTGTSCDGIDFAAIDFNRDGWSPSWEASREYPKPLRKRVLEIQKPGTKISVADMFKLNRDLGLFYADVTEQIIRRLEREERPDVFALHGQTVGHFPDQKPGYTVQLGDPTWLARVTGVTTVSHFREGDLTVGGQGAPLVPFFHYLLAEALDGSDIGVAILNLGGIGNFTYLGPKEMVLASDTGPANLLIDQAVQEVTRGKELYDE
ncbi:MAG: anhydro-N-acetylmuramic acid kinase, partial [Proteobacteria bacterium]